MTIAYFSKKTSKNKVCSQVPADRVSGGHKRWAEGPTRAGGRQGARRGPAGLRKKGAKTAQSRCGLILWGA